MDDVSGTRTRRLLNSDSTKDGPCYTLELHVSVVFGQDNFKIRTLKRMRKSRPLLDGTEA